MTETPKTPQDAGEPTHPVDSADDRLRQTSSKILFGAAGVAAVVGTIGIVNGSSAGGSIVALVLGGILAWLGYHRKSGAAQFITSAAPRPSSSEVAVTDEDVAKARSLAGADLSIEDICRLTRRGYSWWSETDKATFRRELSQQLDA